MEGLFCFSFSHGGPILSSQPPGMHWTGGARGGGGRATPLPLQGAQPMPSHRLPEHKCRPQRHLQPTVTALATSSNRPSDRFCRLRGPFPSRASLPPSRSPSGWIPHSRDPLCRQQDLEARHSIQASRRDKDRDRDRDRREEASDTGRREQDKEDWQEDEWPEGEEAGGEGEGEGPRGDRRSAAYPDRGGAYWQSARAAERGAGRGPRGGGAAWKKR